MTTATSPNTHKEFIFAGFRCRTGPRGSGLPTVAQAQVLCGLAAGMTQKEIARERGVSPATVKAAVATLLYLLHAQRATAVVAQALRRGWIAPLLLALIVSGTADPSNALRVRQPVRTRQQVSVHCRLMRRDLGSIYA